ncbi:hypothetical protein T440DRAFT_457284 [Plenodomus tracheiphilus IPT5]|uniref:DUF2415 domain-containing protein n=1 Tax=Plenodomus tracheiphilus IPT5 TaxID=1408161 RepID=A0A6A7AXZ0_9PLEO|nr:hypothetical protein T440DRAFT_457284 [Plenodomus tracheiphilus IPT5]
MRHVVPYTDGGRSRDTDAFVLPSKAYYPTKIPIAHFQLRHFISCPEPDLIYYASGPEVYCLNAATRTQAHVATLPFEARCTSAGHGYVCVGGAENGNFAAIKVAGLPPADSSDVDASLPLDLQHRLPRAPQLGTAARICLEKIGENIVNSISIHRLPDTSDDKGDVVAVLTNNDKTVRIYSLTQNLELSVLDLPFAMNHATISPDGQMLVAVGDSPTAYFFEYCNVSKASDYKALDGTVYSLNPEWTLLAQVDLYIPDGSRADGYFTTAWSPSSRLCAAGSECGYITVFDTEVVRYGEDPQDAITQTIRSTRPDVSHGPGSVRTMYFSPAPWDLLIWSEDQGRVCVADLRTSLIVRQTLTLDPKEDGIEKVEIADFDLTLNPEMHELRGEAEFLRRYHRALDSEGTSAAVDVAQTYIDSDYERRRTLQRQLRVVESDNDQFGLSAHERQVIETLRSTRSRADGREPEITPRSIVYNTSRQRNTPPETGSESARRAMAAAATEYMLDTSRHRAERSVPPRRQASVIVSIDEATVNVPPHALTHITDSALTRSPNPVPAHARRATNDIISSTDAAWRTIEEAHAARVANGTATWNPSATELRSLRQVTQMRERLRLVRAGQMQASSERYDAAMGVRTAGLAMSSDGRTLYCGTEEGIFEFKINLHARKAFPAVTPR